MVFINKMFIKFVVAFVILLHSKFIHGILTNRSDHSIDLSLIQLQTSDEFLRQSDKCTNRLHAGLDKLRRRQLYQKSSAFIDLSGYALHQTLRHLPLDMYVTDIRVKTPGIGDWVRIQKCHFSIRENRMSAQILFNDLTVSGTVQLIDDNEILKNSYHPTPKEFCKMSLRLQRAGLGINAFPTRGRSRGIDVRTEATFVDPKFLSVHAYGCKLNNVFKMPESRGKFPEESVYQSTNEKYFDFDSSTQSSNKTNEHRLLDMSPRQILVDQTPEEQTKSEIRVITLNPDIRTVEDSSKWLSLHSDEDNSQNDFHRLRVLNMNLQPHSEREKLKAILHIQKLIAQQANHVFQSQGPFSQNHPQSIFKPVSLPDPQKPHIVSTITELDEHLSPVRPIPQRPFDALFGQGDQTLNQQNNPLVHNYLEEVSKEMEDIFLRGVKTLLTRYVEKQLEIPLKEALMTNIGYTVSYG